MNINELFESIQDEFLPEELRGEFLLHDAAIIWSYALTDDTDEQNYFDIDEDESIGFELSSSEELLQEGYQEDLDKLYEFLDENEEMDNWTISDGEIVDDVIVFKITQ